jgi:uncharacterized membrane protein YsdA (DUF1294 family)
MISRIEKATLVVIALLGGMAGGIAYASIVGCAS